MFKWIALIIIIIGLSVIAYPFARDYFPDKKTEKMLDYLDSGNALLVNEEPVLEDEIDSWIENDGLDSINYIEDGEGEFTALSMQGEIVSAQVEIGGDDGLINPESEQSGTMGEIALDPNAQAEELDIEGLKKKRLIAIGKIYIPKIELNLPIVENAGKTELRYAVGHVCGTADFGRVGNCVLAGHRNLRYGSMYNRLGELEAGDDIFITVRDGTRYRYVVYETLQVPPGDAQIGNFLKDERRLTLVTCTPIGVATHRLLVRAHLESVEKSVF